MSDQSILAIEVNGLSNVTGQTELFALGFRIHALKLLVPTGRKYSVAFSYDFL